eukprot:1157226-Pelagomonas_calceolata.AAC.6
MQPECLHALLGAWSGCGGKLQYEEMLSRSKEQAAEMEKAAAEAQARVQVGGARERILVRSCVHVWMDQFEDAVASACATVCVCVRAH